MTVHDRRSPTSDDNFVTTAARSPAGSVTVTLGPNRKVVAVGLAESWDRECRYVEDLPDLILDTIRFAAPDATPPELGDTVPGDDPASAYRHRPTGPGARPPSVEALDAAIDAIVAAGGMSVMLDALLHRLEETTISSNQRRGLSADGYVSARVNYFDEVTGLHIDADWSAGAKATEIADACTQAIAAAYATAPTSHHRIDIDQSTAGQVQAMLSGIDDRHPQRRIDL